MSRKAVIAGASGLVGSELLNILLQQPDYNEVLALVRHELPVSNSKLTQLIIDFEELDHWASAINGHVLFCCLGSTQKKTPDLKEYYKIDHDYPLKLAQLAYTNHIQQYHIVSAIGANKNSAIFYNRVKGETEADIEQIPLKTIHIYQPSALAGKRKESRILERIVLSVMKVVDNLLIGGLKKYRSIPAAAVAAAMYKQSLKNEEGIFVHPSDKIKLLA